MAARERLPDRRLCESYSFQHGGMKYTASIARYADGRLAEIFISNGKSGSRSHFNTSYRSRQSDTHCCVMLAAILHRCSASRSICWQGGHDRGHDQQAGHEVGEYQPARAN
jgi:hypothetical protein